MDFDEVHLLLSGLGANFSTIIVTNGYWEINYRELRFSDYQFIPLIDGPSVNSIGSVPCTLITKLSIL